MQRGDDEVGRRDVGVREVRVAETAVGVLMGNEPAEAARDQVVESGRVEWRFQSTGRLTPPARLVLLTPDS
jgi:hypothetical protein